MLRARSLTRIFSESKTTELVTISLGVAFLVVCAQVAVPLPFTPVPLTLQTFGIVAMAGTLGVARSLLTSSIYLLLGLCGLPVFAGGLGGFEYFFAPTAGYLVGFVPASCAMAYLCDDRLRPTSSMRLFLSGLLAHAIIFFFGVSWLSLSVGFEQALVLGFYPFIFGTLIKCLFASASIKGAEKIFKNDRKLG